MAEYLEYFLDYTSQEVEDLSIQEINVSAKGDGIVYVAFVNLDDIHELHVRIAECNNHNIQTRNFIPPQFWDKYMYINKACTTMRQENPLIKTQIRFTSKDIEVLIKEKGTAEPFKVLELDDLLDVTLLPQFDHTQKWQARVDRPPRRKLVYSSEKTAPPSHVEVTAAAHPISRQGSTDSLPRKKQRLEQTPHFDLAGTSSMDLIDVEDL